MADWPGEAVREVAILNEALDNATMELERERMARRVVDEALRGALENLEKLREAVRAFLVGELLDEHGRFMDARRETLYRAAARTVEPDS